MQQNHQLSLVGLTRPGLPVSYTHTPKERLKLETQFCAPADDGKSLHFGTGGGCMFPSQLTFNSKGRRQANVFKVLAPNCLGFWAAAGISWMDVMHTERPNRISIPRRHTWSRPTDLCCVFDIKDVTRLFNVASDIDSQSQ